MKSKTLTAYEEWLATIAAQIPVLSGYEQTGFEAGAAWGREAAAMEVESYSHWLRQQNLSSSPTAVRQLADKIRKQT